MKVNSCTNIQDVNQLAHTNYAYAVSVNNPAEKERKTAAEFSDSIVALCDSNI